ncbi:MAG: c-type cytochrome [Myxococcales bacterium]|nr:c-type cytochrome [Myxococcales bacterium]
MRNLLWSGVVCLVGLVGCRGWESDKPPVHLIPNMDTQEKVKSYRKDTTGLFEDGRTMRAPVEGTVALGQLDEDDTFFKGTDEKGEYVLALPATVKGDDGAPKADVIARGKERFKIYCTPCHGPNGDGDGLVNTTKGLIVPPPSMHSDRVKELKNGRLYAAIAVGVNNGNMASYAAQIPVEDRWAIVAFVRDLERQKDPNVSWEPGGDVGPPVDLTKASADLGKKLYKDKGCNACHSLDGSKLVGPSFKGLWGRTEKTSAGDVTVDLAYVAESIRAPMAKIVEGYPPAMPAANLTDLEIESITKYFETLK